MCWRSRSQQNAVARLPNPVRRTKERLGGHMGSDHKKDGGMSRRDFASRLGAAAAGIAVTGDLLGGRLQAAPAVSRRILGANDRVVVASIGIRGQGNALKRGFAKLTTSRSRRSATSTRTSRPNASTTTALEGRPDLQARLRAGPPPGPRRQGHRRRHHRHAEPLARARHHLGAAGRQARLRREAGLPHGLGRPADGRGRARATTRSSRSAR